jgi:hypothetical protein
MLSIQSRIPKAKRAGSLQPVLPLIPIKLPTIDEEKGKFISFELKTRVGQADSGTKYKKFVRKFEEGGPQEWIDLLKDLNEIWTQNSMNGCQDRVQQSEPWLLEKLKLLLMLPSKKQERMRQEWSNQQQLNMWSLLYEL